MMPVRRNEAPQKVFRWLLIYGGRCRVSVDAHPTWEEAFEATFHTPCPGNNFAPITAIELPASVIASQPKLLGWMNVLWAKHQQKFPEYARQEKFLLV